MFMLKILTHPFNKMVLEYAFDKLVEEVWSDQLVNVCTREMLHKQLRGW